MVAGAKGPKDVAAVRVVAAVAVVPEASAGGPEAGEAGSPRLLAGTRDERERTDASAENRDAGQFARRLCFQLKLLRQKLLHQKLFHQKLFHRKLFHPKLFL